MNTSECIKCIKIYLILIILVCSYLPAGLCQMDIKGYPEDSPQLFSRIPDDTPLDAVKWTGGFWMDYTRRLNDIYLPGTIDGSFLEVVNGATFRNFFRAAGMEKGGAVGRGFSDGDCFFLLDAAARVYAGTGDEYLKSRLNYWITIFEKIQRDDGRLDTWLELKDFDEFYVNLWDKMGPKRKNPRGHLHESEHYQYNLAHLYKSAYSYYRATGSTRLLKIADKFLTHYIDHEESTDPEMQPYGESIINYAYSQKYSISGETRYLNRLQGIINDNQNISFGPPLNLAQEIYGHNCRTSFTLLGLADLYNYTGDTILLEALNRLIDDLLSKKIFITGAVGPVKDGYRPDLNNNGITYKGTAIGEAIGDAFDLPNDGAYCESCGHCLYMELFFRMFRLTGECKYMDAVERSLYNAVPGCVDLNRPNFFYCNPQEQGPLSERQIASVPDIGKYANYTWRRTFTKTCACCPAKVLRALAMGNEIAYTVNEEGIWVNLFGNNEFTAKFPWGGGMTCRQITDYPWDGKVRIDFDLVETSRPFKVFLRIPGWLNTPVSIRLNGKVVEKWAEGGNYIVLNRNWKKGDRIELSYPMPVKFMIADPRVKDNLGKVAVMRGPLVYCLEDCDIPANISIDSLFVSAKTTLKPVLSNELGGVIKLEGSLESGVLASKSPYPIEGFIQGKGLYQEINLEKMARFPAKTSSVKVSFVPYYTRLNRLSNYFKVWLPVCADAD